MWFAYIMVGNVLWSAADVTMSMIMNRIEQSPVLVSWFLSVVQLCVLLVLFLFFEVEYVWISTFAIAGIFAYIGNLTFFRLLKSVDVSVSSAAWVFMSIGIALGGFIFFGESWTDLQTLGAILSVSGVFILSFWHKRIAWFKTLLHLISTGLLFVPSFLIQKAALLEGIPVLTVFFWSMFFMSSSSVLYPIIEPQYRRRLRTLLSSLHPWFLAMVCIWVCLGLMGFYLVTMAYSVGNASLVGIAENGQPFFLIAFAWIATLIAPRYAPKEILTAQSTGVKIVTFLVVFAGLGLLATS